MNGFLAYLKALVDSRLGRTTPGEAPVRVDAEPLESISREACDAMRFRASHIEPIEDET